MGGSRKSCLLAVLWSFGLAQSGKASLRLFLMEARRYPLGQLVTINATFKISLSGLSHFSFGQNYGLLLGE